MKNLLSLAAWGGLVGQLALAQDPKPYDLLVSNQDWISYCLLNPLSPVSDSASCRGFRNGVNYQKTQNTCTRQGPGPITVFTTNGQVSSLELGKLGGAPISILREIDPLTGAVVEPEDGSPTIISLGDGPPLSVLRKTGSDGSPSAILRPEPLTSTDLQSIMQDITRSNALQ